MNAFISALRNEEEDTGWSMYPSLISSVGRTRNSIKCISMGDLNAQVLRATLAVFGYAGHALAWERPKVFSRLDARDWQTGFVNRKRDVYGYGLPCPHCNVRAGLQRKQPVTVPQP